VGIVAGRTVGNAVRRNRAKRLLRETMRQELAMLHPGWDIVLIARPPLAASGLAETRASVESLLARAGLVDAA